MGGRQSSWEEDSRHAALLFGLAPIAGWKMYAKVGQVNNFLQEKGDQRRNIQVRYYLDLPT